MIGGPQGNLHKQAPTYLCPKFVINTDFGYKGTRGENKFHTLPEYTNSSIEFQTHIFNSASFRSALKNVPY